MPIDYNPDKYVFRHHVIPETNEGLDIGRTGLRFGTIRAAACAIDSGTFQTVTAATLLLGTESVTSVLPTTSATGLVTVTNTATPTVAARSLTAGSAQLAVTNGNGVSGDPTVDLGISVVQGDLIYGSAASTLAKLAKSAATTRYLANTGATNNPAWDQVNLANGVTGTLPIANGGTGLSSGTSGGILGYTATGTITASALLTANALLLGGGAGATPTALSSLGTTTTVLHGNALGAPTFAAVSLTADVSGILPTANGGTGIAFFTAAGPTLARTYTFPDASTTILTTNAAVTVAQGGTGLTTGTSGGILGYTAAGTLASSGALTSAALVIGGGAGATPSTIAALTNGQLPIGSTGANPVPATLTAGSNITITNGAGSITIASTGGAAISGTPVANQVAVWASASAIKGDANFTWDGTNLAVIGTTRGIRAYGAGASYGQMSFADAGSTQLLLSNPSVGSDIRLQTGGTDRVIITAGVQIGAPTGGDKGAGAINVAGDLWKNNTAYNNPGAVFEFTYSGQVSRFANEWGLQYTGRMSLEDTERFVQHHYELPLMAQINPEGGLYARGDSLLGSLEEAYLHLFDLNRRLHALETYHS